MSEEERNAYTELALLVTAAGVGPLRASRVYRQLSRTAREHVDALDCGDGTDPIIDFVAAASIRNVVAVNTLTHETSVGEFGRQLVDEYLEGQFAQSN